MLSFFMLHIELYLVLQICFLVILGVILREIKFMNKFKFDVTHLIYIYICLILFGCLIILWFSLFFEAVLFNYQLVLDQLSFFFKFLTLLMAFFVFIFSYNYNKYEKIKTYEYLLLLLLSIVGMLSMISSYDFLTMYLSIELQTLCFYIVASIKLHSMYSIEAGLKYFILGALSSCILLFGISIIYGFTGITNFSDLMILFNYNNMNTFNLNNYKAILLGIIFVYCGLFFKVGIVPFHLWLVDIYHGAPSNIVIFFAVVPQFSIISLLIRLNVIFVYSYWYYIQIFFMVLGLLSITVGTIGAIYQVKLRRILGYSTINNMGYLLCLLSTLDIESLFAAIFYLLVYNIIAISLWSFVLTIRNRSTGNTFTDIRDLFYLYNSDKFLGIYFCIILFSAMGVPPLLGFFSKLYFFINILNWKMYIFTIYILLLNSISSFYYLRLIQYMFSKPTDKQIFIEDPGQIRVFFMIMLLFIHIFFFFISNTYNINYT